MYIYVLKDPRTDDIRYVGVTSGDLNSRLAKHVGAAKIFPERKLYKWMNQLIADGVKPTIEQIANVCENEWADAEKYYISYYNNLGYELANVRKGGDGMYRRNKGRSSKSIDNGAEKHKKEIYQIDAKLNIVTKWKSMRDASVSLGLNYSNIANSVSLGYAAYGYFWCRVSEYENWRPKSTYINQKCCGHVKIQSNLHGDMQQFQ